VSAPLKRNRRSELAARWDLVCLSPHFDDAALSAGGWLHQRAAAGARTLVITVCAAPPPPGALSPFAAAHHRRWGAAAGEEGIEAARMTRHRRLEDEAALAALSVEGAWLDVPDAIYRRAAESDPRHQMTPTSPRSSRWLYANLDQLFGPLDERERAAVDSLARSLADVRSIGSATEVLVPLGVGGHVDHRLVRAAAERWRGRNLVYYEDWPYARDGEALSAVVDGTDLLPERLPLAAADIDAKIRAIAAYDSQISTFWPSTQTMAEEVRARARQLAARGTPAQPDRPQPGLLLSAEAGPGAAGAERIWRLSPEAPAA
jgi:LmbE family N-acetylglucosaminyl deacetylase